MSHVNYLAVLLVGISNTVIGLLLHGPVLGQLWMRLANVQPTGKEKFSDIAPQLAKNFVVHLVFAFVFAILYTKIHPLQLPGHGVADGIKLAVLVWAGFLCTTTYVEVIWMGRSFQLWLYEAFCSLLASVAMGAIIASL